MGCEVYKIFFDLFDFFDFICAFFETVWRIMFNDFAGNFPVLVCCLRSHSLKTCESWG